MKQRVFVTRKIPDEGLRMIAERFDTTVWPSDSPPSVDEIVQNAKDCEGLVTLLSDSIDSDVISKLPKLKVIAQYAVGYDNIDVSLATDRKIAVTNTPGVLTETTADLAWTLIMAAARRIVEADRYVREGKWNVAWGPKLLLGSDIYGATLGIIGMGRIGSAVARRAFGFNMKVLYQTRSVNEYTKEIDSSGKGTRVDLHNLLKESDIITLHIPLSSETHHLLGEEEFNLMKHGSIIVNTSRGAVIDEEALFKALESGHLGAAGLDVFKQEPLQKNSPLLKLPNLVLAPHIGSASTKTRAIMAKMCAENLIAVLNGERPPNLVNPEVFE
ncbi:D-glycerate dehydrogenase [Candidatus Thorarchaeota archaeon]|nr:MAG: D-glycerate dehydrogenase [Candidatus Thorarchaeota archaeon]